MTNNFILSRWLFSLDFYCGDFRPTQNWLFSPDVIWRFSPDPNKTKLKGLIKETDMLVFVMPVYYYNWPAQLKTVIDRFYSFTAELTYMHKKTVLLTAAWDDTDSVFSVVEAYYRRICEYMQFEDCGMVLGGGCGTPSMTRNSGYIEKAYELGKSI